MYDYRTSNGAANNGGTNRRHGLVSLVSGAYQIFAPVLTDIMDRARSASENITQSLNGILETYRIDRTVDVAYLKGYRKKNGSQIIIAQVRALLANAPISPNDNMHLLDEEYVIAEYDEAHERIVQSDFICREKIASNIMENLNANGGILFIVDKTK